MTIYDHVERLVNHFQISYDTLLEQGAVPIAVDGVGIYVIVVSEEQFWQLRESIVAIRDYVEGRHNDKNI